MTNADPFDLARFVQAQAPVYATALAELRSGRKRSHWMWFIFPQLDGLGFSSMAKKYGITSRQEALAYHEHALLGARLADTTAAVLAIQGRTAAEIFGAPDDLKLRSSMTLFASVTPAGSLFAQVLDKYFQGQPDPRTLRLLDQPGAAA